MTSTPAYPPDKNASSVDASANVIPPRGISTSFRAAFAGVTRTIATQRNMKIHMLAGLMVMLVGIALPLDLSTRTTLGFAVAIVLFAEILNTGLEALVDLFVRDYRRLAMLAKDAAAGGVLVLATATVVILAEVLRMRWDLVTDNMNSVRRTLLFGVPLVATEFIGLFYLRRGPWSWLRLLLSLSLLFPLVVSTKDPIYAAVAVGFILLSAYARAAQPRSTGRGAPRQDTRAT